MCSVSSKGKAKRREGIKYYYIMCCCIRHTYHYIMIYGLYNIISYRIIIYNIMYLKACERNSQGRPDDDDYCGVN